MHQYRERVGGMDGLHGKDLNRPAPRVQLVHGVWPTICMSDRQHPRRVPCHTPILGRCGRPLAWLAL